MSRFMLVALFLFASCASTPKVGAGGAQSPEQACSFKPKNCPAMSEEAYAECVGALTSRQGSACYPQLLGIKDCFAKMAECDGSGELIENDNGMADCNYENGELEACCAAHPGDASCEI